MMEERVRPGIRRSTAAGLRRFLIAACLLAALPVAWRVGDAAVDLRRAMAIYQQGVDLERAHRFDEAAAAFRTAIALYPKNLDVSRRLARVEIQRGRIDGAIAVYRGILAVYPNNRSPALYREIALIELSDDRLEDAQADLMRAVALNPHDWRAHQLLGQVYRRQGDDRRADASLRRADQLKRDRESGL